MNKFALALLPFIIVGCNATEQSELKPSFRELATSQNLNVGVALTSKQLREEEFAQTLIDNFDQITPEHEMKWSSIQPVMGKYDFSAADEIISFAQKNAMEIKGHTLVWHVDNPDWLVKKKHTPAELELLLEDHIKTVVGRYKGQIYAWDVVNEAFADNGTYRDTFWFRQLGESYIEKALVFAHKADPDALLFYNDYGNEGMSPKANAIYRLVKNLKQKNIPIHGIGMQLHLDANSTISDVAIAKNIARLQELGLQVHFTEVDVRVSDDASLLVLRSQEEQFNTLMKLALYYPNVTTYTTWGLSDKYSWVSGSFPGFGRALLFDESYQPKSTFLTLYQTLLSVQQGQFDYQPAINAQHAFRYVLPFRANPLDSMLLNEEQVVFYPFAYNQLPKSNKSLPNNESISGKWAVGYVENTLVGRVYRYDDKTVTHLSPEYLNDNVEIFIAYEDKFWQLRSIVGQELIHETFPGNLTGKWSENGNVFDFTIQFDDFDSLLSQTLGFNIALSDQDSSTVTPVRNAQLYPVLGDNLSWQGEQLAELFMTGHNAVLAAKPKYMPPAFTAVLLPRKPNGLNDDIWENTHRYSLAYNQLNLQDLSIKPNTALSAQWQLGHFDGWLYGKVHRQDPTTIIDQKPTYLNDNVELFLQFSDDNFIQFRSIVGSDFEQIPYSKSYKGEWSKDGTQFYFAIELEKPLKSKDSLRWNIALSDNDGTTRVRQMYPVLGSNRSYLAEELTLLRFE